MKGNTKLPHSSTSSYTILQTRIATSLFGIVECKFIVFSRAFEMKGTLHLIRSYRSRSEWSKLPVHVSNCTDRCFINISRWKQLFKQSITRHTRLITVQWIIFIVLSRGYNFLWNSIRLLVHIFVKLYKLLIILIAPIELQTVHLGTNDYLTSNYIYSCHYLLLMS